MAMQFYSQPFQLFQHNTWWNDKICIIKKEQWLTPQHSILIYYHIYYTFCIGSLTDDIVLEELVISAKVYLIYSSLSVWRSLGPWAAPVREGAGRPRASPCCVLVGVIKENLPACQKNIYGFAFTRDKSHHGMRGRRNLSTDGSCAAHWGKIHTGSIQCSTHTGFPVTEGA